MTCKSCKTTEKQWNGDDRICYFDDPSGNWNCATVNKIRSICYEGQELPSGVQYQYCDDEKYATIRIPLELELDALCLWVQWYKNRGGTNQLLMLDSYSKPRFPTESELLSIVEYYKGELK